MSATRVACGVLVAALVAGCGGAGIQGRYTGQGETFFSSLTFGADQKVQIVLIGATHEGSYEVDGNTLTITAPNGQRTALAIDANGCLSHQLLGTYCKDGSAPAAAERASVSPGGLASRYEADAREGRIALEFLAAKKVKLTMTPSGGANLPDQMSFDVGYEVRGDEITVTLPGNEPLRLTRAGDELEGTMNGETVRFIKR